MNKSDFSKGPASTPSLAVRARDAKVCFKSASAAISQFGRGGHLFGVTKGQFSMIDLAMAVLGIIGPAKVTVWTWCIALYEVQALANFTNDRRITGLRLVIDRSSIHRDPGIFAKILDRFGANAIRATKTHAKIITLEGGGWHVVCRGSMNLNKNSRFENFDVSDDKPIFEVVAGLEEEMWEKGRRVEALPAAWESTALLRSVVSGKQAWESDDDFAGIDFTADDLSSGVDFTLLKGHDYDAFPG